MVQRSTAARTWRSAAVVAGLALTTTAAQAADFTVGPDGAYPTIAEGLAAAIADGGGRVLIEAGDYRENLVVPDTFVAGSLEISGGWYEDFSGSTNDPSMTQIYDAASTSVFHLDVVGTDLAIKNLTVRGGQADYGAGMWAHVRGTGSLYLYEVLLFSATAAQAGGGLYAVLQDSADLTTWGCYFSGHRIENTGTGVQGRGAGVYLAAEGSSTFSLVGGAVEANHILLGDSSHTAGLAAGAGLFVSLDGAAQGELRGLQVRGNTVQGQVFSVWGVGLSTGAGTAAAGSLLLEQLEFSANQDQALDEGAQVELVGLAALATTFRTALIAGGSGPGLKLRQSSAGSRLDLGNVTIADNAGGALLCDGLDAGTSSLANVLLWGNGEDQPLGCPALDHSLAGVDPRFLGGGNAYQPHAASPAVDQGNDTPTAGLSTWALYGTARTVGAHVDIGAIEARGYDASVTLTPDGDSVLLGGSAGYDVTLDVVGPEDATQASVRGETSQGATAVLTLVSGSGSCTGDRCTLGTIAPAASFSFRLVVTPVVSGAHDVTVYFTSVGTEYDRTNNEASVALQVIDPDADAGAAEDAATGPDAATSDVGGSLDAGAGDAVEPADAAVTADGSGGIDVAMGADATSPADAAGGSDAAGTLDATVTPDSALPPDAASAGDAGPSTDAAVAADASTGVDTLVPDGASSVDASGGADTGGTDAGAQDTAQAQVDATASQPDARSPSIDPDAGGCGCAQASPSPTALATAALLLLGLVRRRRV